MSKFEVSKGNPLTLGATVCCGAVNFAFAPDGGKEVELLLYKKGGNRVTKRIPFEEKMATLTKELGELFEESNELEGKIRQSLKEIGFEF